MPSETSCTKLRTALQMIAALHHADTCSHALVPDTSCDCHVNVASVALAAIPACRPAVCPECEGMDPAVCDAPDGYTCDFEDICDGCKHNASCPAGCSHGAVCEENK